MAQQVLFSGAVLPPHRAGHLTQTEAAKHVAPAAPTMRERVFAEIEEQGVFGRTNDEISVRLGMLLQTVCGRVRELQGNDDAGLPRRIVDSGHRRKTRWGCEATVWIAVSHKRQEKSGECVPSVVP